MLLNPFHLLIDHECDFFARLFGAAVLSFFYEFNTWLIRIYFFNF
jgi:hypothetical protein